MVEQRPNAEMHSLEQVEYFTLYIQITSLYIHAPCYISDIYAHNSGFLKLIFLKTNEYNLI